jgi:hypothetical protein
LTVSFTNKWLLRIGIVIAGLIIGFFVQPKSLNKYVGRVLHGTNQILADGQRIEYIDVRGDGNSDEFIYYHLSDNRKPLIHQYSSDGNFKNLWHLEGEVAENFDFIAGDYNNDTINEVFVFSYHENWLCLYGLIPDSSNSFLIEKKSIHKFENNLNYNHVVIHSGGIVDLNGDGMGEVIFSVNSRFTPTPRCVFAYDIASDTLLKSPELGMQLVGCPILFDIDHNNTPELFLATLNRSNQGWTSSRDQTKYSASIVLQSDLTYFMVPVLFESQMSVSATFPVVKKDQNYIGTYSYPLQKEGNSRLILLNKNGEVVQQKKINSYDYVFDPKRRNWNEILLFNPKGTISQFDEKLNFDRSVDLKGAINQVTYLDIDSDNEEELLVVQNNLLKIYRNNFTYPVSLDIPGLNVQKIYFSVKKDAIQGNQLSIQNINQQYFISYAKNPYYWMRYIIYLGSIALLYALYFLLSSLHIGRVEKIKDDNEKFYLMQMELIRSQLDQHFLLNALNSISFSINKDERKTAYYNLGLFSKFLRESIITLDDFSRSLEEEIDYVKNYLTLEKFRFKEKFDYDFIISPGVNKAQKVPKLILFSFIESALKKGVLPKSSGGRIEITIDNYLGKGIYILISDTGMHRNIGTSEESHTTNMLMMKRIVSYFNTFNAKKIEIYLKDTGSVEDPKGSTAEITIPPDYKYIV